MNRASGLSALCLWILLGSAAAQASDLEAAVRRLASPDPGLARAAAEELRRAGSSGQRSVWDGFDSAAAVERRARSRWVLESGSPESLGPAVQRLDDPDPRVRANLLRYLGQLGAPGAPERELILAALLERGRLEGLPEVRRALGDALVSAGGEAAARALAELIGEWPAPERGELAARLAELRGAGEVVVELVRAGLAPDPGTRGTAPEVLAALLEPYGRALADRESAESAPERAPFALGLRHPDALVRRASVTGLEAALERLRILDRPRRAEALLGALAREGPDARAAAHEEIVQALQEGRAAEQALTAARELERLASLGGRRADRVWRYRAVQLAALAELAAGRDQESARELERASGLLDALLAERADLGSRGAQELELELLHQRALLELTRAVLRIARGHGAADVEVLEHLRSAHELELRAQLAAVESERGEVPYIDRLLEVEASPYRALFVRRAHPAWPVERQLAAQEQLGRALATIAPREVLGFEPVAGALPGRADPLEDPPRRGLLLEILRARSREAWRQYTARLDELGRQLQEGRAVGVEEELALAQLWRNHMRRKQAADEGDLVTSYSELRGASFAGLAYAQALGDEGRRQEARAVARRMLDALEAPGNDQRSTLAMQLGAQLRMAIGSTFTADDAPAEAEAVLQEAVERLESLEAFYAELGAKAPLEATRRTRAGALVSLAVNANVKLGDVGKALDYFQRAYALREDDFMRVLLACYKARSGDEAEARAILGELPHAPRFYYNLACTYALLGERERALELLERELAENHAGPGSLAQQKEWARKDPDLASLRDDPRFELLVGEEERPAR